MWSFYWPIIRRIPKDFLKSGRQTHGIIFLIVDIILEPLELTGRERTGGLPVWPFFSSTSFSTFSCRFINTIVLFLMIRKRR